MEKSNQNPMGTKPIASLIFTMGCPPIVSMFVQSMYNIVDSIFVAQLGENALTAVSLAAPIQYILLAVSVGVGVGINSYISRNLGADNIDEANNTVTHSMILALAHSILFIILGLLFIKPFFRIYANNDVIFADGCSYTYIVVLLSFSLFFQITFEKVFQATGKMLLPTISQVIGAVLNIILDPIFIFGLNLGVKGAALATIISQFVSAMFVLKFLFGNKTLLKIRKEHLKLKKDVVLATLALGIAPFIMQSTESIVLISLNNQLLKYGGDIAVSAMTIMSSMMQMIMLPMTGLTQGAQPILSYNYGAQRYDRVKQAFKLLFISSLTFTMCAVSLLMIFPEFFVKIFSGDIALVEMTSWSMRIYFAGMGIFGMQLSCQQTFLSLGQAKISLFLALLRKMILLVPLIFILPMFISDGLTAVLLAEPIADIIACLTTTTMFVIFFKKNFPKDAQNKVTAKAQ